MPIGAGRFSLPQMNLRNMVRLPKSKGKRYLTLYTLAFLADCVKNNMGDLSKLNPLHLKTFLNTLGDHFSGSVCAENIASRKVTPSGKENFLAHKARFACEYVANNPCVSTLSVVLAVKEGKAFYTHYQDLKARPATTVGMVSVEEKDTAVRQALDGQRAEITSLQGQLRTATTRAETAEENETALQRQHRTAISQLAEATSTIGAHEATVTRLQGQLAEANARVLELEAAPAPAVVPAPAVTVAGMTGALTEVLGASDKK